MYLYTIKTNQNMKTAKSKNQQIVSDLMIQLINNEKSIKNLKEVLTRVVNELYENESGSIDLFKLYDIIENVK